MAFVLKAHTSAESPGGADVTTGSIDTTGADFLVISLASFTATAVTVSDSKGNSWTPLTIRTGNAVDVRIYYSIPTSVGSGHTFTVTGSAFQSLSVAAFSGSAQSSVFEAESGVGSASASTLQPGSLTPSADNYLIITGQGGNSQGHAGTTDSPFTSNTDSLVDHAAGSNGFGTGIAWDIQTTATARNPTWDWGATSYAAVTMAVFKVAAGGVAQNSNFLMFMGPQPQQ